MKGKNVRFLGWIISVPGVRFWNNVFNFLLSISFIMWVFMSLAGLQKLEHSSGRMLACNLMWKGGLRTVILCFFLGDSHVGEIKPSSFYISCGWRSIFHTYWTAARALHHKNVKKNWSAISAVEGHWSLWEGSTKKNEKKRKIERRGKEGREREREKKNTRIEKRSHAVEQGERRKKRKRKKENADKERNLGKEIDVFSQSVLFPGKKRLICSCT